MQDYPSSVITCTLLIIGGLKSIGPLANNGMLGNLNLALFPVACHVQLPDCVEQINAHLEHAYCEFWHHMCNARCLVHALHKNPGCSQIIDLGTHRALTDNHVQASLSE